ncbi:MAG: class I SAM-dependent methyltransferase [Desulfobacteraceae bacterium]|nr:MAG: class I SAM-dependent methyltransferase [Desulfobacteraceae bacterium]
MLASLKENWTKINELLIDRKEFNYLTPVNYRVSKEQKRWSFVSGEHVTGVVLDLGAGKLPARRLLQPLASYYVSVDRYPEHPELTLLGDAQSLPFKDRSFDTVHCISLLEHLPRPWEAAEEMARVLKKGGKVILRVPHIYYIHGQPHDYYRYTGFGVKSLFENAGLEVVSLVPHTGQVGFIASVPMTLMLSLLYPCRPLFWAYYYVNKLLVILISRIDDALASLERNYLPLSYTLIAKK